MQLDFAIERINTVHIRSRITREKNSVYTFLNSDCIGDKTTGTEIHNLYIVEGVNQPVESVDKVIIVNFNIVAFFEQTNRSVEIGIIVVINLIVRRHNRDSTITRLVVSTYAVCVRCLFKNQSLKFFLSNFN